MLGRPIEDLPGDGYTVGLKTPYVYLLTTPISCSMPLCVHQYTNTARIRCLSFLTYAELSQPPFCVLADSRPQSSKASKFARAHAGPVNSLCFTPDGLHLLTSGTDNRYRPLLFYPLQYSGNLSHGDQENCCVSLNCNFSIARFETA